MRQSAAMDLFVAGLSHRTAPIALRERVSVVPARAPAVLARLLDAGGLAEGMVLSTCNRTEIYGRVGEGDGPVASVDLFRHLAEDDLDPESLGEHLYAHQGDAAVTHLFRVTAGLESMVLGEPQIAGQVSTAYEVARRFGTAGPLIHRAVPRALQVGKRVRSQTGIGRGVASVAGAGVSLVKHVFRDLSALPIVTVGAGETVRTALTALRKHAHGPLTVLNRTHERAWKLAEAHGGRAAELRGVAAHVADADIVITATGAAEPLLLAADLKPLLSRRRGRPLLILDLGVPRDVDAALRDHEGVFLYDVDDLQAIADRGRKERVLEVPRAEAIIAGALDDWRRRRRGLDADPAMRGLLDGLLGLRRNVVSGERGLSDHERKVADRVTGKFVDRLIRRLAPRIKSGEADVDALLDALGVERRDTEE
jgi:glutamyl-tRNA reductase